MAEQHKSMGAPYAVAGAIVVGFFVLTRLLLAEGESFSYDYANYLTYFRAIQDTDWATINELLPVTAPYVFIAGGGVFEIGFVVVSKWLLHLFDPALSYALLGAASLAIRTYALRRFGLGWGFIAALHAYSITLFEANALRAGLALSITLAAVLCIANRRWFLGIVLMALAASQHLQTLLFAAPFLALNLVPRSILGRWWGVGALAVLLGAGTLLALQMSGSMDISKLDEYSNQSSAAVGFNLISVLSLAFMATALLNTVLLEDGSTAAPLWSRALLAGVPSLALVLFGSDFGAIGDRAWQFSLVMVAGLSAHMTDNTIGRYLRNLLLGMLLSIALLNILIRYPQSNFFAPPLPYEPIVPIWLAR